MTRRVYILFYIHTNKPNYSEILGVYDTKDRAVDELLERANFREKNGVLTQYLRPTNEYKSMSVLRLKIEQEMELVDVDIYRISALDIQ